MRDSFLEWNGIEGNKQGPDQMGSDPSEPDREPRRSDSLLTSARQPTDYKHGLASASLVARWPWPGPGSQDPPCMLPIHERQAAPALSECTV